MLAGLPGLDGEVILVKSILSDDVEEAGISSHSSPAMSNGRTKKEQRVVRRSKESRASANEMGTGDDLTTAVATSAVGKARRFRLVGFEVDPTGLENNLREDLV